ncbi:DUF6345 domain-containing protein [Jidongwangia harbinensis]|uniref:DUF6345 domain-containing protein n=1 Tax=Jidongwangia harbinensis TaxID=2878561 RepID=UPI001CD9C2CF|nr:DUF6345 domain-containing protein [Jidongwangia harbinensis]MCA2219243.1 DUF6345 domain-containing protein [Jidongwangia harbinensis]
MTGPLALAAPPAAAAVESPTLPVYAVRSAGLTAEQATTLAKALGIKQQRILAADGSVRFADEKQFLAVPTKAGKRGRDEDGNATTAAVLNTAALKRLRPLAAKSALDRTARALRTAKIAVAGRATTGHTTLTTVDKRGRTTTGAKLDTTVSYSFTLNGLPLQGPGAKVRVAYNAKGAVTGLSLSTRTLVPTGAVEVLDPAAALRRCAVAFGAAVQVRTAQPAYWAPALAAKVATLAPSFRCTGVLADGSAAQVVFVPAAVNATLPEAPPAPQNRPQETPGALARAYGRADVGSEGTGPCSGLPHTGANLATFNNEFSGRGIPVEFSWLNQNAWEQDFKDPSKGGDDSDWTDHVDMTYWQGHGAPTGFSFSGCSSNDDTFLAHTDARWGNGDVEWMSLFTCLILEQTSGGKSWWQRWGPAFDGLHQINSFHTVSYHSAVHGGIYANYLLRSPFLWWNKPMPVRSAWAQASIDDQPDDVVWASMGAIGPGGAVNLNDYFWNKGAVGPDIPAAQTTGYWYLSGLS